MKVYVAGPLTEGDRVINVRKAIEAANQILDMGHIPFLPHLYFYWHQFIPRPYEDWMALDFAWLETCDALVRLTGISPGGDREVKRAKELGILVFHGVESFRHYLKGLVHEASHLR